jgi:N-acetylneuraminate lyase
VVIQVGANSLTTCRELAEHAESIGATAISANAPSYFKISTAEMMVDYAEAIAASAPRLPFYYYHIPGLTGASIDLIAFLEQAEERIPTLRGVKYTDQKVFEFQDCLNYRNRKFEMLWGCDEMLLSALAVGAEGGIGSTYGLLPAVYRGVLQAWRDGNLTEARKWQLRSWHYVKLMNRFGNFHAAQKALHKQFGIDLGPCRLPLKPVTDEQEKRLQGDLESLGYFEWAFPR